MKKSIINIILLSIIAIVFNSCNNDLDMKQKSIELEVNSKYSRQEMIDIISRLGNNLTRAVNENGEVKLTESQAHEMLQPLIDDGKQMQTELLRQIKNTDYASDNDIMAIEYMSDEELASLSFIIAVSKDNDNFDMVNGRQVVSEHVFNAKIKPCLLAALGIGSIKNIYNTIIIKGGISTAELLPILKIIGKRYCAYVSLAFFIYDVVDCLQANGVLK